MNGAGAPLRAALCALALPLLAGCVAKSLAPDRGPLAWKRARPTPSATPTPRPSYPQARPVEPDQPVVIHAQRLRYNARLKETFFSGGVRARQGSTTLDCDELAARQKGEQARAEGHVVVRDPERKVVMHAMRADYTNRLRDATLRGDVSLLTVDPYGLPVTVTSQEAEYWADQRRAWLGGGVRVFRQGVSATAGSADFVQDKGLTLEQGAVVRMGANLFSADSIQMDSASRRVRLRGGVKATFIPEQVEALSKER